MDKRNVVKKNIDKRTLLLYNISCRKGAHYMKKSGSIVRKILFFNIFTSVSIVLIFTVLYMVFSSIELKKDMEARSEAVGTS